MDDRSAVFIYALVAVLMPYFAYLLSRWLPKPPPPADCPGTGALRVEFHRSGQVFRHLTYAAIFAAIGAVYLVGIALLAKMPDMLPEAAYTVVPTNSVALVLSVFIGFVLAEAMMMGVARLYFRERFRYFMVYASQRESYNSDRLRGFFRGLVAFMLLAVALPSSDWYVQARDDGLYVDGYFSLEETSYPYSEMQEIRKIPGPSQERLYLFEITMQDGRSWNTRFLPSEDDAETEGELIRTVSRLAEIPVTQ